MASSRPPSDDPGPAKRRRATKRSPAATPSPAPGSKPDPTRKVVRRRKKASGEVVVGLLGFGLDGTDGHKRITKGDDFFLVGGSAETHEKMQDLTIRLTERLKQKGKRIAGADPREIREIVDDLSD